MVSGEVVMNLNIKLSNHFKVLYHELCGVALMIVVLSILKFDKNAFVVFGIWFTILTLPVIYLHIEYYIANRGIKIIIENGIFTVISRNKNMQTFKLDELKEVILYKSASMDKGGIPITPIEPYHYARIITRSDKQIIITCLMYPKLEEVINKLQGVQKIRKKRLFCTLAWH